MCIGIHHGEVVVEAGDIFGDTVNIAAGIQSAAEPGTIYISKNILFENIKNEERFKDLMKAAEKKSAAFEI